MKAEKSLTGRTVATVSVSERGAVEVTVQRGGQSIHSFSIAGEPDLPKAAGTKVEKVDDEVLVYVDGKVTDRIPVV